MAEDRVPGHPNLTYKGGRPSKLNDPSFLRVVCELFAAGLGRGAMIEELQEMGYDVRDKQTIARWRRDPRVKAQVSKLNEDRAIQISRRVDAIISGRLAQASNMSTKDLVMLRREFGGATLGRHEIAGDDVTVDALKIMEDNPGFEAELEALLTGKEPEPVADAEEG